ncbi:MAG: S9 family peptidase [Bryobacterales bacterium]|nr:S9 family peptidase [Bryobacterales bacterium]
MNHRIKRFGLWFLIWTGVAAAQQKRPMTFMDVMNMRSVQNTSLSPDGKWLVYTCNVPDWKEGKSFTDIHLVSVSAGVASSRQMTFTKGKNETSPQWSRDSRFLVFSSNREAPAPSANQNQLYLMRPDGGEARRITDAKDGVGAFAFSRDGKWLAFSAGKEDQRQIWAMPAAEIETANPVQWTRHATPVDSWQFAPDSQRIYFLALDRFDKDNKDRIEKKFNVTVRNQEPALTHLWSFDVASKDEKRLTDGGDYTVSDVVVSQDSKWAGFRGTPKDRYMRTVMESATYSDLYLLEAASGKIERLTNNREIGESALSFSPDSKLIAFSADNDFTYFRDNRLYVRPVAGGAWRKLGDGFDGDVAAGFWSQDAKTVYFGAGIGATRQVMALAVDSGKVTQVTQLPGVVAATQDRDTHRILMMYSDPQSPPNLYTVPSADGIAGRAAWTQLTSVNPLVSGLALGRAEAIRWKSTDGQSVEGVLVLPPNYERGKRYPLIVQIHGGPASASLLTFDAGYGDYSNIYAGAGYVCLKPNYRGSSNYGERFRMQIAGDYFRQGYEDIMAGVDHLIKEGIADPDRMGSMGWSAGGHWSNWILTHTDRFKAISSGAGAMNWISMYAQNDTQRLRENYFGGLPYDNFDKWWNVSPLKYIKNAKTPTLIHVVDGDPRVPRPQSEELYMALKKLGVPTEFFVYPGSTHGIPDARNQLVKMVAEFNWFEKYLRGKQGWFEWKELLDTLPAEKPAKEPAEAKTSGDGSR